MLPPRSAQSDLWLRTMGGTPTESVTTTAIAHLAAAAAALTDKEGLLSPLFWSALLSLPVCGPINVALHSEDGDLRAPRSEVAPHSWDHKAPKSAIFLLGNVGQILTEVSSNLAHLEAPFSTDCSVIALLRIRFRS